MKICPECRTEYDNSQNFCLNDGTPLVIFNAANEPRQVEPLDAATDAGADEPATVIHVAPKTNVNARQEAGDYAPKTASVLPTEAPIIVEKKSNVGRVIVLTALATALIAALAGAGIYLAFRNQNQNQTVAQVNDNKTNVKPKNSNANSANVNSPNANVVNLNQNANLTNSNLANVNANVNASPSPQSTLKPEQTKEIKKYVSDTLEGWRDATNNRDLDSHMSFYGQNVDYYNGGLVNASRVRADREKAFENNSVIEVELSNIKITPDPSGTKASVTLDKAWHFEGDAAISEGKVQQQLTLEKFGNNANWYITGEKDLKVYYKNKY